jgi:hypothetical protein
METGREGAPERTWAEPSIFTRAWSGPEGSGVTYPQTRSIQLSRGRAGVRPDGAGRQSRTFLAPAGNILEDRYFH